MNRRHFLAAAGAFALPFPALAATTWDVAVYGASAGGVMAAVAAARGGARTVLIGGGHYFGGDLANGLSGADTNLAECGGAYLELFQRVGVIEGADGPITSGAPSSVYAAMMDMVREAGVHLRLNREMTAVGVIQRRVRCIHLPGEDIEIHARGVAIDATAMGDLLAATSNRWTVGREADTVYGEPLAGYGKVRHVHRLDPYLAPGQFLPQVEAAPSQAIGSGDRYVQSATFRPALSMAADRVPFTQPPGYNPNLYLLQLRSMNLTTVRPPIDKPYSMFELYDWDLSDYYGAFVDYPLGSPATRRVIRARHESFVKGWFYFFANDPQVPAIWRDWYQTLGWARSQFTDSGNFPRELYVREGRRLVGSQVLRQQDAQTPAAQANAVCIGSHSLDSHAVRVLALPDGLVQFEGMMGDIHTVARVVPYQVPYEALVVPDLNNLLIGNTAISASHVFHSAARTRGPSIGEAAGTAAAIAVKYRVPVWEIGADVSAALVSQGIPVAA